MKSYWQPPEFSSSSAANNWDDVDNWSPHGVPRQIAVFKSALKNKVTFSTGAQSSVSALEFEPGADGFTFMFGSSEHPQLTVSGDGVFNHSGVQQSIIIAARSSGFHAPQLAFANQATAGGDNMYYQIGPLNEQDYGGGVLHFQNNANAGSARYKIWTGAGIPPKHGSTVGGEVAFSDNASAHFGRFVLYGSLGTDGDTFGNVVFHDTATAANGVFENIGGTVSGGDGGNTQFYGTSTAANGIFYNYGGTHAKANGGDVAFDTQANGGNGIFHNYAAPAADAYGGVTSFNNNWPDVKQGQASSAGNGTYINYGARNDQKGGGGHLSFSAKYGSPTAANAMIENYGSVTNAKSSAGHTIFSISLPTNYFPTAAKARIHNHPAPSQHGAAGYTEFAIFSDTKTPQTHSGKVPTAEQATIINFGGYLPEADGGYTVFADNTSAGSATLIAHGGTNKGYGGKIAFYDEALGDNASISLEGNGELDLSYHKGSLTIASLTLTQGVIRVALNRSRPVLSVSGNLSINSNKTAFCFAQSESAKIEPGTLYPLMDAPNLENYNVSYFEGNAVNGLQPTFELQGSSLMVTFN